MALLNNIPTYNIKKLNFECSIKRIGFDASDLGIPPGVLPHGRLYDDACDEGVKLINVQGTNTETVWHFVRDDVVRGEVMGWHYAPTPETVRKHPKLDGWTLLIAND